MLLSINPVHVENILSGVKRFEFRKTRCRADIDKIIMYSISPVMQVVGEAEVVDIIEDKPEQVWKITADASGINKDFFDKYYRNKQKAIAYQLGRIKKYKKPLKLVDFGINFAPQSFIYVD
jgi:predicted transcriptional regulator